MKILIIANYEPDGYRSMQRFALDLIAHLQDRSLEVSLSRPPAIFGKLNFFGVSVRKWLGYMDKYVIYLPYLFFLQRKFDLVHIVDQGCAMYVHACNPARTVVTCHDLFAVQSSLNRIEGQKLSRTGTLLQRWILSGLRKVRHFTTVSAKTGEDIVSVLGDDAEITVIPNAVDHKYAPAGHAAVLAVKAQYGIALDAPYLFHVGGNSFYKNRAGVVRIFDRLARELPGADLYLVLAGVAPDAAHTEVIASSSARQRIVTVIEPSDEAVIALYSGAAALLFPSLMEGFGWPVIEAQACGCPVITSDREPMRSISGGAAILVPPEDDQAAAEIIAEAFPRLRQLRERGFDNAARYSPDAIYSRYLDLYDRITRA